MNDREEPMGSTDDPGVLTRESAPKPPAWITNSPTFANFTGYWMGWHAERRRRYWRCEDCGSLRVEAIWTEAYVVARIDPEAKRLQMLEGTEDPQWDDTRDPDPSSIICLDCAGCSVTERRT